MSSLPSLPLPAITGRVLRFSRESAIGVCKIPQNLYTAHQYCPKDYYLCRMRDQKIQIFRALAIIAVVMIHTTPPGEWQVFCKPFINFAVAAFIFLSGYLTKAENDDWMAFYRRRIMRVAVPYVIWTILDSLFDMITGNPVSLLKNLLSANANVSLYYIFVYVQFVLLTPLIGRLAKSRYCFFGWLVSPVSGQFRHRCLS